MNNCLCIYGWGYIERGREKVGRKAKEDQHSHNEHIRLSMKGKKKDRKREGKKCVDNFMLFALVRFVSFSLLIRSVCWFLCIYFRSRRLSAQ